MNRKSISRAAVIVLISFGMGSTPVLASEMPIFTSCPNPGGVVISQYSNGTHGIPGDGNTYTGADTVYRISSTQVVQCFCPTDAQTGIQTNWLKIVDPGETDIADYQSQGWVFIPDGSLWGLESSSYMAKNQSMNCQGGASNTGSNSSSGSSGSASVCDSTTPSAPAIISVKRNGSTATLTWTTVPLATHYSIVYGTQPGIFTYGVSNTGNVTQFTVGSLDASKNYYWEVRAVNNCAPSVSSTTPIGGGEVLGSSTSFAPTGDLNMIMLIAGLGLILLGLSIAFSNRREVKE